VIQAAAIYQPDRFAGSKLSTERIGSFSKLFFRSNAWRDSHRLLQSQLGVALPLIRFILD